MGKLIIPLEILSDLEASSTMAPFAKKELFTKGKKEILKGGQVVIVQSKLDLNSPPLAVFNEVGQFTEWAKDNLNIQSD